MTKKDGSSWVELCEYVKKEILRYDDNMKFPTYLALKLKGLKDGKFIANKNIQNNAKYDDFTLLYTFKLCRNKIIKYIDLNESKIKDEKHRINIIMKIVEPEINDVYIRLKHKKDSEIRFESSTHENQFNKNATYTPKTEKTNKKLENLL